MALEETLALKLSTAKASSIARMVSESVESVRSSRATMEDRVAAWWERYEVRAPRRTPAFAQGANLRTNLTQWVIDSMWVRLMRTVCGQDPYMRVVDESLGDGVETAPAQDLLQHLNVTDLQFRQNQGQALLNCLVEGTAVGKLVRRNEFRTIRDRENDQLVERTIAERPGLGLDVLDFKDFLVANAAIYDVNRQPWVAHRVWLRWDDLVRRQRDGLYTITKSQLGKIKGLAKSRRSTISPSNLEQVKADLDAADEQGWEPQEEYEVIEGEWRYDADGDGLEEECLFTVLADWKDAPLRAQRYPFWNGYRNYLVWRPLPRANRFYGRSPAGIIQMLQDEADVTLNQSLDASALAILANLTPILSRGMQQTWERHKWNLAKPIYVDVPENFRTLGSTMTHRIDLSDRQLDRIFALAERASGVSDPQLGKPSEGDKTAFEIRTVAQEGNVRFSEIIEQIQDGGNRELGFQTLEHAYQLSREDPLFFARMVKVCGQDPFAETNLRQLRQRFDVQPVGNTTNSNKDMTAKTWAVTFQTFSQDKFVMLNAKREWYLRQQTLAAMGLSQEAPLLIGTQEEAQQMQQQAEEQQAMQQKLAGVAAGFEVGKMLDPNAPQTGSGRPGTPGNGKPAGIAGVLGG